MASQDWMTKDFYAVLGVAKVLIKLYLLQKPQQFHEEL